MHGWLRVRASRAISALVRVIERRSFCRLKLDLPPPNLIYSGLCVLRGADRKCKVIILKSDIGSRKWTSVKSWLCSSLRFDICLNPHDINIPGHYDQRSIYLSMYIWTLRLTWSCRSHDETIDTKLAAGVDWCYFWHPESISSVESEVAAKHHMYLFYLT